MMPYDDIKSLLKKRLTEKRCYHSLCVADAARHLAEKYGADDNKMYLAGLLHDITKNTSDDEQLKLFARFGIILTDVEKASPQIWHAMSGALYAEHELGIKDDDIISAIRYHTTAKRDMTLPQKIIYVADLISADRDYGDVEIIRKEAEESLETAMLSILSFSVKNLIDRKLPVHPDTLDAYNYLMIERRNHGTF